MEKSIKEYEFLLENLKEFYLEEETNEDDFEIVEIEEVNNEFKKEASFIQKYFNRKDKIIKTLPKRIKFLAISSS